MMNSPTMALLALPLMLWAGQTAAQTPNCNNPITQAEMTQCAYDDWHVADATLNDAYKAARKAMRDLDAALDAADRGAEKNLLTAQRAWVTFRDAHCAAEGFLMRGGSAEPMLVYGCMARMTQARTQELQSLAVTY